jgi:hypothetical protein
MKSKLIYIFLLNSIVFGWGGFDNGTAIGKGKFRLDLTMNLMNKFHYGQSYAVLKYGINDRFNIHGYFSSHNEVYFTWYTGLFYQFLKLRKIDISTAIGIRQKVNDSLVDFFFPQLLYNIHISKKIAIGGSIVGVKQNNFNLKPSIDIGLSYKLNYKSKLIDDITIVLSGFHPATWSADTFFLPTYSLNLTFN